MNIWTFQVDHQLDLWHVSKGVTKKLTAKSKNAGCSDIADWIQSITNHMWYCSATCNGDALLLK